MLVIDQYEHASTVMLRNALVARNIEVFNPEDITSENASYAIAVCTTCKDPVEDCFREAITGDGCETPEWTRKAGRCFVTTQFSERYFHQSRERIIAKLLLMIKTPSSSEQVSNWDEIQEKTSWL